MLVILVSLLAVHRSRRAARAALASAERRVAEILSSLQSPAVVLDPRGMVTFANASFLRAVDLEGGDVVGHDWFGRFVPEDERDARRAAFAAMMAGEPPSPRAETQVLTRHAERRRLSWDMTVLRDDGGRVSGLAAVGTDVTDRARTEELHRRGALTDALTGLPNRTLFMDRLALSMARARRRPEYRFAALFLDIDRFKVVNDSLGHGAGDELLVEVGRRLEKCLRPGDSVARLGGDEFAVLIDEMGDAQVPELVAARILAALSLPFQVAGREVFLTASIGTAVHKPRYDGPEDFMRDADTAMHHAKAKGKARHEVFETSMHRRAMVLLQIENDLHRAVQREELSLHYQPIVSLRTGKVSGFEALVRWELPGGGFVPPGDFIRIAEDTGLIIPMGAWVLRQACLQVREWQHTITGAADLVVSVNLSAKQFGQPDLVAQVARTVLETGLDPASLKLEVTESILMHEPEAAASMLRELRAQRVQICIDDFGTGYSSLSYLLRFPAHTLKIDRSFVSDMASGRQQAEMVRTIVALARNLGMDVIAEGVETEEQVARLRAMDCDFMQGFVVSRPVDPQGAARLLAGGPIALPEPAPRGRARAALPRMAG
ncbi:MAG TPA: EAL domain-containing protein [Vicinamibacteria bacterium]|nr:EAL domain-containing protein [Vicinamibacteria bacterium]